MMYLVTGLPRNGKSFYVVKKLLAQLEKTRRHIYTDLPLIRDNITRYLLNRKKVTLLGYVVVSVLMLICMFLFLSKWYLPAVLVCAASLIVPRFFETSKYRVSEVETMMARLHHLTRDEVHHFWRHRPILPKVTGDKSAPLDYQEEIDYALAHPKEERGCVYYIDEAHIPFDSYNWDKLAADVSFYVSQHGKLKDDVFLITQHLDKLAKRLKLDCQYYIEVVYKRRQTILGFQKGYHFVATGWSGGIPENEHAKRKPNSKFPFLPKASVLKCYDSTAGFGVVGTGENYGEQHFQGLPPWALWLVVVLVLGGVHHVVFRMAPAAITQWRAKRSSSPENIAKKEADKKNENKSDSKNQSAGNGVSPPSGSHSPALASATVFAVPEKPIPLSAQIPVANTGAGELLWVRGKSVAMVGGHLRYYIQLSDGRQLTHLDGTVKRVGPNYVDLVDGRRLWTDQRVTDRTTPLAEWEKAKQQVNNPEKASEKESNTDVTQATVAESKNPPTFVPIPKRNPQPNTTPSRGAGKNLGS